MMAGVAVVAVILGAAVGLWRRSTSFRELAHKYEGKSNGEGFNAFFVLHNSSFSHRIETNHEISRAYEKSSDYYAALKQKYDRAAARPWLPVRPDPPPPAWPDGLDRPYPQRSPTLKGWSPTR
jgi:hypothetical protein